ncbi:MAG: ParB/RepB/Spo0J family partition protein [Deltaproteobacteria bacterium]|nr:MAG: ParB/RepB/Spo0J family partition protein [Deltaproteobacteria bacterium]
MVAKKMGLGKGLAALIPEAAPEETRSLLYCGIEEIRPNRFQPRQHFDETRLQELTESVKEKGILEPLLVRKVEEGYELIAGERRWRAAQKAGVREVPILVKKMEDHEALEVSLIENLQRDDLNPLEEATAYRRLLEEFGISQEELGTRLGKDRTTVANTLRLLKLPPGVKDQLLKNRISSGHARAILSLDAREKQEELCDLILRKGLSVREAETLARQWAKPKRASTRGRRAGDLESQLNDLGDSLRRYLGTKVRVVSRGKRGKVEIEYYSFEDLERIVETILKT